jgi:hypothetical protein
MCLLCRIFLSLTQFFPFLRHVCKFIAFRSTSKSFLIVAVFVNRPFLHLASLLRTWSVMRTTHTYLYTRDFAPARFACQPRRKGGGGSYPSLPSYRSSSFDYFTPLSFLFCPSPRDLRVGILRKWTAIMNNSSFSALNANTQQCSHVLHGTPIQKISLSLDTFFPSYPAT